MYLIYHIPHTTYYMHYQREIIGEPMTHRTCLDTIWLLL